MEKREKGYNTQEDWALFKSRDWTSFIWMYNNVIKHYKGNGPIEKILDIGTGPGLFLDCCIKNNVPVENLYGIEGEEESLEACRKKGFHMANIDLDTDPLPYPDNNFSVIVCAQLIEHIKKEASINLIKEVYRVLKPGGLFLTYSPSYYNVAGRTMPFHMHCWKPYDLRDLMKQTGFKNIITKVAPLQWYDLKTYDPKWHPIKYGKKLNILEKSARYAVYALFKITRSQNLLGQTAFAASK